MERSNRRAWAERVAAWKASGLTCKEFARQAGINPRTLSWWKWRLGSESRRGSGGIARAANATATQLTFVEVDAAPLAGAPIELVLEDGVVVRVPVGFDADTLREVLTVLGRQA